MFRLLSIACEEDSGNVNIQSPARCHSVVRVAKLFLFSQTDYYPCGKCSARTNVHLIGVLMHISPGGLQKKR